MDRIKAVKLITESIYSIVFVMSLIIITGCIYIDINEKINGKMTFFAGYKLVYIESGSMEPAIKRGSFIILRECKYEDVREGDIITFETESGYVTHRLIGIDEEAAGNGCKEYLITKGDANNIADPERLNPEFICGVYKQKDS